MKTKHDPLKERLMTAVKKLDQHVTHVEKKFTSMTQKSFLEVYQSGTEIRGDETINIWSSQLLKNIQRQNEHRQILFNALDRFVYRKSSSCEDIVVDTKLVRPLEDHAAELRSLSGYATSIFPDNPHPEFKTGDGKLPTYLDHLLKIYVADFEKNLKDFFVFYTPGNDNYGFETGFDYGRLSNHADMFCAVMHDLRTRSSRSISESAQLVAAVMFAVERIGCYFVPLYKRLENSTREDVVFFNTARDFTENRHGLVAQQSDRDIVTIDCYIGDQESLGITPENKIVPVQMFIDD